MEMRRICHSNRVLFSFFSKIYSLVLIYVTKGFEFGLSTLRAEFIRNRIFQHVCYGSHELIADIMVTINHQDDVSISIQDASNIYYGDNRFN